MERHGKSKPIFRDGFHNESLFVLYCFWIAIFLVFLSDCVFFTLYKDNHGLEVPREMRLEKLMRLLEVSKKMHGGKAELSTNNFWDVFSV